MRKALREGNREPDVLDHGPAACNVSDGDGFSRVAVESGVRANSALRLASVPSFVPTTRLAEELQRNMRLAATRMNIGLVSLRVVSYRLS
jgi:hypothetical protein